jgi:hypothetical protein
MIKIGADRFRSRAAASPEFGAGSGGNMNDDTSRRLDSIEKGVLSMQAGIASMEKSIVSIEKALIETRTKLDTVLPNLATKAELAPVLSVLPSLATKAELAPVLSVLPHLATKAELAPVLSALPHLATKAELEAMQIHLIRWVIGTAVSGAGIVAVITTLASHVNWH